MNSDVEMNKHSFSKNKKYLLVSAVGLLIVIAVIFCIYQYHNDLQRKEDLKAIAEMEEAQFYLDKLKEIEALLDKEMLSTYESSKLRSLLKQYLPSTVIGYTDKEDPIFRSEEKVRNELSAQKERYIVKIQYGRKAYLRLYG